MNPEPLPASADLDQLRRQARELLNLLKAEDPEARRELATALPNPPAEPKLSHAQTVVARRYGFPSWPRLRARVDRDSALRGTIAALRGGRMAEAERLAADFDLAEQPALRWMRGEVGSEDFQAPLPPLDWPPILYVCFSRAWPSRRDAMLNCLKTLLDAGADPNAHYWEPSYPELPETCLYGVCGINNEPEATALLLAAGADAQDAEALYHGTEHPGIAALRQVLAAGGRIALANGLNHILDRECVDDLDAVLENIAQEPEDVRAPLLRSGGFWAVMRHRSLPHMQKLVNAGLDVNATNDQGLNLVDTARKLGQTALADWLVAQGARESADVRHRFLAACAAGDGPTARRLRPEVGGLTYDDGYVLGDAAQRNDAQAVALMLDLGFPADAPADHRSTGLHQASWHGCHRTVPLLLAAGCPVDVRDKSYDGTPLNWAVLGCPGEPVPDRDWVAVVQALLDFGAARSAGKSRAFLDENSREKPVRPLLVRYGIVKEKM